MGTKFECSDELFLDLELVLEPDHGNCSGDGQLHLLAITCSLKVHVLYVVYESKEYVNLSHTHIYATKVGVSTGFTQCSRV